MNAFEDSRVFPVAPNDQRLASFDRNPSAVSVRYEQYENSPVYLVVGPSADDNQLSRAADRFGVPLSSLVDLRDRQAA